MKKIIHLSAIAIALMAFAVLLPVTVGAVTLEVATSAICENVVNREVVNEGSTFSASVGKLYCFSKIANVDSLTEVVHAWYCGNTERARVTFNVNPPAWRTYSSKIIQAHETGSWRVEILDASGNLLETVHFEVTQ
ncbi:MAG: DUF2914 domain-containing protein [Desulfobacterales bacterium]|nr:MAG: DUF2914 domain-containing protein [Desulfobacterales bacterium]